MRITQDHVSSRTRSGANLIADGATFRVWAPRARGVYLNGRLAGRNLWKEDDAALLLEKDERGYWSGFLRGVRDGDQYLFWVEGPGGRHYKRDPCARELTTPEMFPGTSPYPFCNCVVRRPDGYAWRAQGFRQPAFNDLVIYELHVGTFYAVDAAGKDRRGSRGGQYLDVIQRVPYLQDLEVNALELLPIHEFASPVSRGYDGADLYSPEMDYAEFDAAELQSYAARLEPIFRARSAVPLEAAEIQSQVDQLKALVDACHLYGIAVILDVVYNHAGGAVKEQSNSLWFFDELARGDANDSLYFMDKEHAGGPVFAFWNEGVQDFLIDNARFYLQEYRADGLRYDQVTVIDEHGGWFLAQKLAAGARAVDPSRPQIAEFWLEDRFKAVLDPPGGLGFDANWNDGLREAIRGVIGQASGGREARISLDPLAARLQQGPRHFPARWRSVEYLESHDVVDVEHADRQPRIPSLADPTSARSWYATSRSRVAAGLLLAAPGIPMLFMGQEFLEDKYWTDNDGAHPGHLIYWEGLESDKVMQDFHRFMRELIELRLRHPALRGEAINVFHVHEQNRVLALHRWLEGRGRDAVVVCSLNESTFWSYRLGFPLPGRWHEAFNSDVYEGWVNPWTAGNGGGIEANGPALHGLPHSAAIVLPANSLLVFTRDQGDPPREP